ncbi:MAG: glycosidase [Oscillospiraceae bacterium]|nr:glycosidase [Oscillospiraceae bacterium]
MVLKRCPANPIVVPGTHDYRRVSVFNPGVIVDGGVFYMYERAAGSLRPFKTSIGLLKSADGVHFEIASDKPIFTGEMLGFPDGSVEDARVVKIDGTFYMCYALQPYAFDCWPTGVAVPDYYPENYPEWRENNVEPMITRSGIAVSGDGEHFKPLCYTTPADIDDRDNALFPEKIGGKFAILRRPMQYVGKEYGADTPGIWISFSEDLFVWSKPELIATAEEPVWEGLKIGAAATPLKTESGWMVLYHGVDASSVYRVGAMLLDLNDPRKVIARTRRPIMEPEYYYEKTGLVINNTVFPTANLIHNGEIYIYYGCCDTSISLATVPVDEMLRHVLNGV